ncbi:MAG: hypothetical protein Kow00120_10220 [Anaerolineae bacterium]
MNLQRIDQLLTVSSTDPEDARRRKLLNILLLGVAALALAVLAGISVIAVLGFAGEGLDVLLLFLSIPVTLAGIAIVYAINRYRSGVLASALFLLFLTFAFAASDVPQEVANGRSLMFFVIPVIMASVLLRPYASFIMAGIAGALVSLIALSVDIVPNVPAIIGFFVVALVSWLSARSLEHTLAELRAINRELDQRVAERTQALAEALASVRSESSKNQAILEGIADGVIVLDTAGRAIVANPAVTTLLELPADQVIGHDIKALMDGKVSEESQQMVLDFLRGEEAHSPSVRLEWGKKMLSVSFASVRDAAGGSIGTVAVFRDFTREAEVERMKSAFVSMASHELRTPLSAILGYADMLRESVYGPLTGDQRGATDRIIANSRRMLGLVNNLLDQAQIEAGRLSLHVSEFAPAELIDNVQAVMGVLAENKGLTFTCAIAGDVPATLHGDPQRLEQILINLAGNAIKFTEKGSVHVSVYRPDADHWALEVTDTGPGIPDEAQSYIFDAFRQVGDPVTRKHSGSGLGLSIVKQITTLMGGDITVKSALGEGSTFRIVLPLTPPQEAASE